MIFLMYLNRIFTRRYSVIIFSFWVLIQIGFHLYDVINPEENPVLMIAVDKNGTLDQNTSRERSARFEALVVLVYFILQAIISGYSYYAACLMKKFWLAIFLIFGSMLASNTISFPFILNQMYPDTVGIRYWILAATGGVLWLFLFITLGIYWYKDQKTE